jgi:hypothetical protein
VGIKAITPNTAFLDQMWLAGIVLFGLLAVLSLTDPAGYPGAAGAATAQDSPMREKDPSKHEEQLREKDLLFDLLSIGAVVATVALVLVFF